MTTAMIAWRRNSGETTAIAAKHRAKASSPPRAMWPHSLMIPGSPLPGAELPLQLALQLGLDLGLQRIEIVRRMALDVPLDRKLVC
jgi:hypothetical protein